MKILLTDCATLRKSDEISLELFKDLGEVEYHDYLTADDLLARVWDADIVLCNKTKIDAKVMNKMPNLKFIGLFATGFNNIDTEEARKRNIVVSNAGSYSTSAVAQQVFAYILEHFCRTSTYCASVKRGDWINATTFSMFDYPTDEIAGKTIGIIGFGSIGKRVAAIAKAFEMNVLVYNRTVYPDCDANFVSLDELLQNSDIITVHCPLNEQSNKMFNKDTFSKCKNGAFFINTARGGVLDEQALFDALESGKLSGAGIDVLETEPMRSDCVLRNAPNIIITPHMAWAPVTTRNRLLGIVYNNIKNFLDGKPTNVVS